MTNFKMVTAPEGPDPKRLLLAVIATSAVLLVYSYFFAQAPQVPTNNVAAKEEKEEQPKSVASPQVLAGNAGLHDARTPPIEERSYSFERKEQGKGQDQKRTSYRVRVSNRGGVIEHFALTDFSKDAVIFGNQGPKSSLIEILSNSPDQIFNGSSPYEVLSFDDTTISLRHVTAQGLLIERNYQFLDNAMVKEKISFKNMATQPIRVAPELVAIKHDLETIEPSFFNPGMSGQSIALKTKEYERFTYGDLVDKPKQISSLNYVAFDDQFFLAAILPDYRGDLERVVVDVKETNHHGKTAKIVMDLKPFVLLQGEEKLLSHQFFIGPKQIDLLSALPVPLDENIDFGWFGVLSRPMLWLLVQIFGFVKNYGWAIILITLVIKLLTFPLTQKSFTSQAEMKTLQPKIKELQQKFGHDRTLLGQKQMELYREHGINPVAGCLPILIQLPIWIAFFQMLRNSVELYDQPFYWWITDLTRPDQYFVMPILMGVTMLIQQAFTPPPAEQPQMKYVMWAMPIFLTFIMLNMPSGLSLYMLTNNLLTILQQALIKRQSGKVNA